MKLCVIPARGGSKRIPSKNLKPFCGKPMIAWSIEAAQAADLFDEILVSTDAPVIAEAARTAGASVPFMRPPELADDHTPTAPVMRHAVETFAAERGTPQSVCCLYATAPFVTAERLREGHETLQRSGRSYAFTATSFAFPVQRALRIAADGGAVAMFPETIGARSQDLEEAYHDAGQFYWGTPEAFLEERPIFDGDSAIVRLPRAEVQDIDTEEDWQLAEALFRTARRAQRDE